MRLNRETFVILTSLAMIACGDSNGTSPGPDSKVTRDAGFEAPNPDSGFVSVDSGTGLDAGASLDAGHERDAGESQDARVDSGCWLPEADGPGAGYSGPEPMAYYTFDEIHRAGSTVIDVVGTADMEANAAVSFDAPGPVGQAMRLDGRESIATSTTAKTDAFSVSLWVRPASWPSLERTMILNQGIGSEPWTGWGVAIRPSGQLAAFVEGGGGPEREYVADAPRCVDIDTWVHLAATMDGSTLRLYANGRFAASVAAPVPAIAFGDLGFVLGWHSYYEDFYFDGDVDEVALWSEVLGTDDIREIYFSGRDGIYFTTPVRGAE